MASPQLIEESVNLKVNHLLSLQHNRSEVSNMVRAASGSISTTRLLAQHPMHGADVQSVLNGDLKTQLTYLLLHGLAPEAIYNDTGISKST